jgi:DNA replication protein DnaC
LSFIDQGRNIILVGNPGVGKTHTAIGLGIKACMERKSVLFITVPNLITELKENMTLNQLTNYKKKFINYDLVILDELGYISFDKQGSELLFNLLSMRSEQKSIIITTNLAFSRWQEIFHDPALTAAMVDRLTYKAYVINITGDSYRLRVTKEWLNR